MKIIEDGNLSKVMGEGTVNSVYDEIVSIGTEEDPDFTYDIARLSEHPDDYKTNAIANTVPNFINSLLVEVAPEGTNEDRDLQVLLGAVAANYLDRHDRTWFRSAVEKPIEDLLIQIAEAQGREMLDVVRDLVKSSRTMTQARILVSATHMQTDALIHAAESNEQVDSIILEQKVIAATLAESIGINIQE